MQFECLFCRRSYPADPLRSFCPQCREPMLVKPEPGPKRIIKNQNITLQRYSDFTPFKKIRPELLLNEGWTPLQKLNRLATALKLPAVYAKNECLNPTGSFKDRGTVLAVHAAELFEKLNIGTVSTGNMAVSTAAYGAKAAKKTIVLANENTPDEKLIPAGVYGASLFRIQGDYGELMRASLEFGQKSGIYFMNSVDPFRIEGYKMTGFELYEQLGSISSGTIFVPVSAGGHLVGLVRAFQDLSAAGFTKSMPVFVGVQSSGCAPVAGAFRENKKRYARLASARTIAQSISNPDPPGGNLVLKLLRETGGRMLDVEDEKILEAQHLLAEYEGIFCLPASATTLAGLLALRDNCSLPEPYILIITGSGQKNLKTIDRSRINIISGKLEDLENLLNVR